MEERRKRRDWLLIVGLALILRLAFNWRFVPDTTHADIASMYQYSLRVSRGFITVKVSIGRRALFFFPVL